MDIYTLYTVKIYITRHASLVRKHTPKKKACCCGLLHIAWTLSVCVVYEFGGCQWEGSREGGSKLNVLQRTWGHNSLLFFSLNHTHIPSLLSSPFIPPTQTHLIPTPDQISAHRHSLSRHQHPLRGVSCLEEEEELTPPGSLIRFALRVR